jgi:hypothetical protein
MNRQAASPAQPTGRGPDKHSFDMVSTYPRACCTQAK